MSEQKFIVISDLDGTLTTIESSWQFVLENLDLWENNGSTNLDLFLQGKIDYDKFIDLDVTLLKGTNVDRYLEIIGTIPFRDGLEHLFAYFQSLNVQKTIIISSGLRDLADRLANKVIISDIYANEIHKTNKHLDGSFTKNVGWHDKENIMKELKSQNPDSKIIAFGDTLADLPLINLADISFACFSHSKELIASATSSIGNLNDAISIIDKNLND